MFTLRSTARLLKRLGGPTEVSPAVPSTRLGDWYAHLLFTRPQLVLCVSERTLLPILIPARDATALVSRLRSALAKILRSIDVPAAMVMAETNAMADAVIGKTARRSVLGSINDFKRMLDAYLDGRPLLAVSLHLAECPCGPPRGDSPRDATIRALSRPSQHSA